MTETAEGEEFGSYMQRTPYVFPEYAIMGFRCASCGHCWNAMALIGTQGVECPNCHQVEEGFLWQAERPAYPHDGAWLTAHWDLPMYTPSTAPQMTDAEMVAEAEEDYNLFQRVIRRLQVCWWVLKGEY